MNLKEQSDAGSKFKQTDKEPGIFRTTRNRVTDMRRSALIFFDDIAFLATMRVRTVAQKLRKPLVSTQESDMTSIDTLPVRVRTFFNRFTLWEPNARRVLVSAMATLIVLILTLAPARAIFQLAVYSIGSGSAFAEYISEDPLNMPADENTHMKKQEFENIPEKRLPLASSIKAAASISVDNKSAPSKSADEIYLSLTYLAEVCYKRIHALGEGSSLIGMHDDIQQDATDESVDLIQNDHDSSSGSQDFGESQYLLDSHMARIQGITPDADLESKNAVESYATAGASGTSAHDLEQSGVSASAESKGDGEADGTADDEVSGSPTDSTGSYIWPAHGNLTSRFGYRSATVGSTNHKGIDICAKTGDPIYAADAGEVIVSGWSNSFGYVIEVRHDNGHITLYAHCSSLYVSVGERVKQGQVIAGMGCTGRANGVHLHFELKINGENVDPLPYLP